MRWYYLIGSQPTGPVEEPEIDRLFGDGTITLGTRVWRQGLQTWKTFAEAFNRPSVNCFKCKRLSSPDLSAAMVPLVCARIAKRYSSNRSEKDYLLKPPVSMEDFGFAPAHT